MRRKLSKAFEMSGGCDYLSCMGSQYKIRDLEGLYFMTFTIIGWIDLFIRDEYRDCILDSFKFCIDHKGFNLHAYVIMTSHIHLIASSREGHKLQETIRDMKKFTSKQLINLIKTIPESRREWMLNKFEDEAKRTKRGKDHILWQEGYHAKQIVTNNFLEQKLNYIHENPVKAGFVSKAADYTYSSARNYSGEIWVIEVDLL
jgi:REP element-mobilizing transposase RayT